MVGRGSLLKRGLLAVALLVPAACAAHGTTPRAVLPTPTPTPFTGSVGAAPVPTIYAFHNTGGENGLPVSPGSDGASPKGTLTMVNVNGTKMLFGRTAAGGNMTGCGAFFEVAPNGTNYAVVHRFSGTDGCSPRHDAMIQDAANGLLYSTTQGVTDDGSTTYNNGEILTLDPVSLAFADIHDFAGSPSDGAEQHSSFSIDPVSGVLYGQSALGGANGEGLVYRIAPGGGATTGLHDLVSFDGEQPHGRIVQVGSTLWGISRKGGASDLGTVFSIALSSPGSPANVVHSFTGVGSDGAHSDHGYLTPVPAGGGDVILYGMTQCGGTGRGGDEGDCSGMGSGDGVIFQIDTATGAYNTFYQFTGTNNHDGADPYGSLLYDAGTGYLYGMTRLGGSHDDGIVFRIAPGAFGSTGTLDELYHFTGTGADGAKPIDNVILDSGKLYGMTTEGGSSKNDGTIFALPL